MNENKNLKKNLEKIFLESVSPEVIFDAFQLLIFKKIEDMDLFRVLLANPTLNIDEIIMYSEQLIKEFPKLAYEICLWTGYVFESKFGCTEYSLRYYKKAHKINPSHYSPLLFAIGLFNFEYEHPLNKDIIEFSENAAPIVKKRSIVFNALAELFKKLGNKEKELFYLELADRSDLTED